MPAYSSFWKRFVVGFIDFIFFVLAFLLLTFILLNLLPPQSAACVIIDILLAGVLCYVILMVFWVLLSATPGKLLLGIRIVDATGSGKPKVGKLLIRGLLCPVSLLPLGLGFWWALFDSRRQAAHDKFAGTVVINRPKKEETPEEETWAPATEPDRKRFVFMKFIMVLSAILLLVVVPVFLYYLGTDEQLSDQAREWYAENDEEITPAEENAFYLVAGFTVPADMDPVTVAVEWAENENRRIDNFNYDDVQENATLEKIPVDSIFKELKAVAPDILDYNRAKAVFDSVAKIEELYARSEFLTERFNKLLLLKRFDSPVTPHQIADHSISPLLLRYQNFENAWLLIQYKEGDHKVVIDRIKSSIDMSRNLLKEADNMLIKLICSVLLQKELRLVNILLDLDDSPTIELHTMIMNLQPLTSEEISLRKAILYESRIAVNSADDLLENFKRNRSAKKSLGYLVTKPNATANIIV